MAKNKNEKKITKKDEKKVEKKPFKNPVNSRWGHILILVLALAMVLGVFATLIYYIVVQVRGV